MLDDSDLVTILRRHWGYDTFRPMQERVVRSVLAGHDVAVVMPTGGGKSLCYQLPALVLGRTAVVISPLIALMQDQAAQLAQMGVPAAFLNSSQSAEEQSDVVRRARDGEYRLLYLSPERLARADTVRWLESVPVAFFAIDEAHCISEWGHEFRPDYRQLSRLRDVFPDHPIAAFTASATRRVRHDILDQLRLHDPHKFIASFHRPNLRYLVRRCDESEQRSLLVAALRAHAGKSVIIYAPTIARVGDTVDLLARRGIAAVPYHGQMESGERQRNQERWMSDEVRVLVGTIAFGLGINKPAVRAVIHLSLPKSIEQYYQEAGRAGRDGEPSDCALLWQGRDVGLLAYFIGTLQDPAERERAWERYHAIRRFAEAGRCRTREICLHFGETPKWETCATCDVCSDGPAWLALEDAEVLAESAGPSRGRRRRGEPPPPPEIEHPVDEDLKEHLREWRRSVAKRDGIPAFMVFHDTTLDDLCRRRPANRAELLHVSGIGERKAEIFGDELLAALRAHSPRLSESDADREEGSG